MGVGVGVGELDGVVLRSGTASLRVSPQNGGRWSSLALDGLELIGRGGDTVIDWGCFAMAPYAGRIRRGMLAWSGRRYQLPIDAPPHAIHGVTVDRPWTVVDHDRHSAVLRCDLDSRWPWAGHVIQSLSLHDDGLRAGLEVHADDEAMPAWAGFHPWFARRLGRGAPARIDVTAVGVLPRDGDGLPRLDPVAVPPGPWDDVFVEVAWPITLTWDGALRVDIAADVPNAVIFDARPGAVCVEPQTAPPNAAELGMAATVEPGRPLSMEMTLAWVSSG